MKKNGKNRLSKDNRRDMVAVVAAYLRAQGKSISDIADDLERILGPRFSAPTICRRLSKVKHELLETRFRQDKLTDEEWEDLQLKCTGHTELVDRMKAKSKQVFRHLVLCYSGPASKVKGGVRPGDWERRLERFATNAAPHVSNILHNGGRIGVTWGHTLYCVICHVRDFSRSYTQRRPKKRTDTSVFPTAGEPLLGISPERSSTNLAIDLAEALNGKPPLTLKGVPPVIPKEFQNDRASIMRFVGRMGSYQQIFGGPDWPHTPLIKEMDTLLTSLGYFNNKQVFANDLVQVGRFDLSEVEQLAVGDIGGVLVPRPGLSPKQQDTFDKLSLAWTGIALPHVRELANRAKDRSPLDKGGVVACAVGPNKASIVKALVDAGLINTLIADQTLVNALPDLYRLSERRKKIRATP